MIARGPVYIQGAEFIVYESNANDPAGHINNDEFWRCASFAGLAA